MTKTEVTRKQPPTPAESFESRGTPLFHYCNRFAEPKGTTLS